MQNIFNLQTTKKLVIQKQLESIIYELNDFFNTKWTPDLIKIILVEDRKTFDDISGFKTKDWMVGFTINQSTIVIFNPDKLENESNKIHKKQSFYKILKHEIVHLYFDTVFAGSSQKWLNEGICVYLANQFEDVNTFSGFLDNKNLYIESGFAVKVLIDNFGKDTLWTFLKLQSGVKDSREFNKIFEKVYKAKLNYDFFNAQTRKTNN